MRIYSLNCILYKAHLLYRTTVDNEKNIGTHVEEIRESTELNYQSTVSGLSWVVTRYSVGGYCITVTIVGICGDYCISGA